MSSGTTSDLKVIWGTGPKHVLVAGSYGAILRFDGTAWIPLASGTSNHLYALWGTSSTDVVAAGEYGTILRYKP
jgi:hypothetical protein